MQRHEWGGQLGVTVGMKIFDGQRKRERQNALIAIEQARLATADLELTLRAQLERLWKSYINNHQLLGLAQENLRAAEEQYEAAQERFMLGDLSGIEMRQAEQNLLSARERLLDAQYSTKICEISLLQISGQVMKHFLG
jgi:outer membrane protein TolC